LEKEVLKQLQDAAEGEYPAAEVTVIRGPASLLGKSLLWSEKQVSRPGFTPEQDGEMSRRHNLPFPAVSRSGCRFPRNRWKCLSMCCSQLQCW
jgi:hypothetical protein